MIDADVQMIADACVTPDGTYTVEPRSAKLTAWWRDTAPAAVLALGAAALTPLVYRAGALGMITDTSARRFPPCESPEAAVLS